MSTFVSASGYEWTLASPKSVPRTLPPIRPPRPNSIGGLLEDGVDGILRAAGLLDVLETVTGDGESLQAAARIWLLQAAQVQKVAAQLRQGAAALPSAWEGEASVAFGGALGRYVAALDATAWNLADTAHLLNRAAIEAGLTEDLVTGIIAEAALWAAAELAATVVADLLTLGLASVAGGLAECATMAAFVARAGKASADLERTLEALVRELEELRVARETIRDATALRKLSELTKARTTLEDLHLTGTAFRITRSAVDLAAGTAAGLPMTDLGGRGLRAGIAKRGIEDVAGLGLNATT